MSRRVLLPFSEWDLKDASEGRARMARGLCISGVRFLKTFSCCILEGGRCFLRSSGMRPGIAIGVAARGLGPFRW